MAFGTFANLTPYTGNTEPSKDTSLQDLLQSLQANAALERLPQTLEQDALNRQLNQLLTQSKIKQAQTGEIQNVGGNLVRINPTTGQPEVIFSKPEGTANSQFIGFDNSGRPIAFNPRNNSLIALPSPEGSNITGSLQPKTLPAETFTTVPSDQGLLRAGSRSTDATPLTVGGVQATRTPPPKGQKSVLAEDTKTGRIRNIVLGPDEDLPEGFKQATKGGSEFKNIQAFRKEIAANPVIKQFADVSQYKQRIDSALEEAKSTNNFVAVDQTLISAFNRLNEPDSVTMVSEYARTSADAPLINRIKANINRITEGGRLTNEERTALSRLANRIYETSLGNYSRTADFFENIGETNGWSPEDYLQPLINTPPPKASPNSGPSIQIKSIKKVK